jgi:predicted nuclease of predicted toxin-antitoxin system
MRFLVDASLPRPTAPLIISRGHDAIDVRDIGMGGALDPDIAAYAQNRQLALVSRDYDFADVRAYPPDQYAGIIVIELPNTATVPTILNFVDYLLQQHAVLNDLPGRLAIVEPGRIRLRPPP